MSNKFSLGDRVTSKKIGNLMLGRINGIVQPDIDFFSLFGANVKDNVKWKDLYPDWADKSLYFVLFDAPTKDLTLDDVRKRIKETYEGMKELFGEDTLTPERLEQLSLISFETQREHPFSVYPEEDLELLDE